MKSILAIILAAGLLLTMGSCKNLGWSQSSGISGNSSPTNTSTVNSVGDAVNLAQIKRFVVNLIKQPAANLANMLGYDHVGGTAAKFIGDDMSQMIPGGSDVPNGWFSNFRPTDPGSKTPHADRRLSFFLTNIGTLPVTVNAQKEQISISPMDPIAIETIQLDNTAAASDYDFTYQITGDYGDVSSYSQNSAFQWSRDFKATINLVLPVDDSNTETAVMVFDGTSGAAGSGTTNNHSFKNKLIKIPVKAGIKRIVKLSLIRQRITAPFQANVQFVAGLCFTGMLRSGDTNSPESDNFHEQYRGSHNTSTVSYTFGGNGQPFYIDLANQSRDKTGPWIWSALVAAWGSAALSAIADLTNQNNFLIPMNGQLNYEDAVGLRIEDTTDDNAASSRVITRNDNSGSFNPTDFSRWGWCYPNPVTNIWSLCPTNVAGDYSTFGP